jgi:hypothetical protein
MRRKDSDDHRHRWDDALGRTRSKLNVTR